MTERRKARRESLDSFLFNVEKWFGSIACQRMSMAEKGVYLSMLFQAWRDGGRLPDDPAAVAELITVSESQAADVLACWPVVRRRFVVRESDPQWIENVALEETRRKQQKRWREQRAHGKKGGEEKARKAREANTIKAVATLAPTVATLYQKLPNSIDKSSVEKSSVDRSPDDQIEQRAGDLVHRYADLFQQYRSGARHLQRPNLDWLDAQGLCRTWDDARLEKLAALVLTTDDPWISTTDRSFKIFAMKASWADDRLTQWEKSNKVSA